ncbi:MAG: MFS transporter, partial [Methanomicrobium sp.]|nr:MFS transporter [Methanomicrobium sp.]
SSFTQPIVGWLYDTDRLTIPIPVAIFFSSFFMAFIGLVTSNYILTMMFAIGAALGHAFFHPGALGLVSRLAEGEHRGKLTSLFVIGGNLGFAIGPLLVGVAVSLYGINGLYLLFIPAFLMIVTLLKVLPRNFTKTGAGDAKSSGANAEAKPALTPDAAGEAAKGKFPIKAVSYLVAGTAFRSWVIYGCIAYLPTYFTQNGMEYGLANFLTSLMLFFGVAGQFIGASLSDKYGRKEYSILGVACAIPPFILFINTEGIISIIALMIFGYFIWTTFSVTVAMSHEMAPKGTGMVSGLILGFAVGSGGLGVAITGYIADMTNVLFGITSLMVPIIIALIFFILVPYPYKTFRVNKENAGKEKNGE